MKKIRIGILFGGQSTEHEVSLLSAKGMIEALDTDKYEPVLIHIDKQGVWSVGDSSEILAVVPGRGVKAVVILASGVPIPLDVVFPILHGVHGEDGTVQGLLRLAGLPFVGADVLGSAIGMDKDVMKRLLREAGLPVGKFLVVSIQEKDFYSYENFVEELGLPFFVKPANTGSSVGVSKVKDRETFEAAIQEAFLHDKKILVEEFICGREIECSILGNQALGVSLPGEIISSHEFYSYEAKYLDEKGAELVVPVFLEEKILRRVQNLAIEAATVLCVEGMARVDFFLTQDSNVFINEINTIPGFTKISMYPKLWQVSGLPYGALLDRLIQLALERTTVIQESNTVISSS